MAKQSQETLKWFRDAEIARAIRTCEGIFNWGVIAPKNTEHPLFEAAVTQLLISLHDLLRKAKNDGRRVAITAHVEVENGRADVTDLIRDCRNAACHISTGLHDRGTSKFVFNVFSGYCPKAMQIGDTFLGCDFEDDIAVQWGRSRLYLRRNALAAFEAVAHLYRPD